nr:hypothetical protein EDC94DRAFT_391327 [Helicostylum pulchrum]
MSHSFSNCPLRSSSLLITNHATQSIVTATDEVLDLLGYSMAEILQHSIHSLHFQLDSNFTTIPTCSFQHANGTNLKFQVCVHQDPLGGSSCLDYWLIRSATEIVLSTMSGNSNTAAATAAISVIRLSPYGTIEQVQPSPYFKQPVSELLGRPVMAFVYQDDIQPLCASLAKICSLHKHYPPQDPLFIRWSRLPCLINEEDEENSLNYDWMSFTLMSTNIGIVGNSIRPICILRPLQCEQVESDESMVIQFSLYNQLFDCYQSLCQAANDSKLYIAEFYHHVISSLLEMLSSFLIELCPIPISMKKKQNTSDYVWDLVKSNYIMQRSINVLEFTGLLDQHNGQINLISK